jgi:sugar/nucleoside kinase (ribokinase family)
MERSRSEILAAIKDAKGIAYYGEILLEAPTGSPLNENLSLREYSLQNKDKLNPAGDVLNVMRNIDILQNSFSNKLHLALEQVFVGPISSQSDFSDILLDKLPFAVSVHSLVEDGEIGLCNLGISEQGDMCILLDSERASIRDAIHNAVFRNGVVQAAKEKGIFYSSLIGLGMSRNDSEFIDMFNQIHQAGVITVFDTNYRSYVMEHCYPQENSRLPQEAVEEIISKTDVVVAGTEDVFSLNPSKQHSIKSIRREFFRSAPKSSYCILKAGRDGVYWKDDQELWRHVPAVKVNAFNTTGAGDGFNAGLLLALKHGKIPEEAVAFAKVVASRIVTSEKTVLSEQEAIELASNL